MASTRLRSDGRVTIPKPLRHAVGLCEGDELGTEVAGDGILLRPRQPRDPEQWWYWTEEWQAKEREMEVDLARGQARAGVLIGCGVPGRPPRGCRLGTQQRRHRTLSSATRGPLLTLCPPNEWRRLFGREFAAMGTQQQAFLRAVSELVDDLAEGCGSSARGGPTVTTLPRRFASGPRSRSGGRWPPDTVPTIPPARRCWRRCPQRGRPPPHGRPVAGQAARGACSHRQLSRLPGHEARHAAAGSDRNPLRRGPLDVLGLGRSRHLDGPSPGHEGRPRVPGAVEPRVASGARRGTPLQPRHSRLAGVPVRTWPPDHSRCPLQALPRTGSEHDPTRAPRSSFRDWAPSRPSAVNWLSRAYRTSSRTRRSGLPAFRPAGSAPRGHGRRGTAPRVAQTDMVNLSGALNVGLSSRTCTA